MYNIKYILLSVFVFAGTFSLHAGNPDRQGEAGAYELLINPWARSAGLHTLNVATIGGAEAMQLNIAGLARAKGTEINLGHTQYLVGTKMSLNALQLGYKMKKGGALGISLTSMGFGDLVNTREDAPEGTGANFSPSFFTLGVGYSYLFANKVSVGVMMKFVNESIFSVSASGVAVDAGVQYAGGKDNRLRIGISLRNVGTKMTFSGEGLSIPRPAPVTSTNYELTYYNRPSDFELPSQLNLGLGYTWDIGKISKLTAVSSFISNAFSRDQIGAGLEFELNKNIQLRAGYRTELDKSSVEQSIDNGVSAGFSLGIPFKKGSTSAAYLDYAYRSTVRWQGIHNISLRLNI